LQGAGEAGLRGAPMWGSALRGLVATGAATGHLPIEGEAHDGETSLWVPVVLSLLAGASTTIGGAVVLALEGEPSPEAMAAAMALAGGVMLTVSADMLLPIFAFEAARLFEALGCFLVGCLVFLALRHWLGHDHDGEEVPLAGKGDAKHNWRLGLLMMATLTAHNFPEGVAVAVSALDSHALGLVVAIAIAMHNIPEGIVIAVPIYAATRSKQKAMLYALLSGLAEPLGALLAVLVLKPWVTPRSLENMLAGVAGTMVTISVLELYPHAWRYDRPMYVAIGTALGVTVMVVTEQLV